MKHKAKELLLATAMVADLVGASRRVIALKSSYTDEALALKTAAAELGSPVEIFLLKNFYPAGDEQVMVCDVTGKSVPPSGIPLDVGVVVANVATMCAVYEASLGKPLTHKYLTVTGEVANPVVVHAPLGAPLSECIAQAGGATCEDCRILVGGPMMGKLFTAQEAQNQVVTKTTSGIVVVPAWAALAQASNLPLHGALKRAKVACVQCATCTEMCPRFLLGHPLRPHLVMRKLAYAPDLSHVLKDEDIRQALICSECGVCEVYACPMGIAPRRVNVHLKGELAKAGISYPKPEGSFAPPPEREYRRTPTKRITYRLGLEKYYDYQIDALKEVQPNRVEIPLKQHIGVPCTPTVEPGGSVTCGQIIGACPENALGANIHASISGRVVAVGNCVVIERGRP